jgi:hypothetical protein
MSHRGHIGVRSAKYDCVAFMEEAEDVQAYVYRAVDTTSAVNPPWHSYISRTDARLIILVHAEQRMCSRSACNDG